MGLTTSSFLVADVTRPTLDSTFHSADNSYINFYFKEAVYTQGNGTGLGSGTGALIPDDFAYNFTTTGNVEDLTITSITQTNGNALEGGETEVRLNISYVDTTGVSGAPPGGTEVMTFQPVLNQIYDSFGNIMEDDDNLETLTTFNLNDILIPTVSFDPVDGSSDLLPNGVIIITFSEAIQYANGDVITDLLIDNNISLAYTDGDQESVDFDAEINDGKTVISVNPDNTLTEQRTIQVEFDGNVFSDLNSNTITTSYSADYTVKDITSPVVVDFELLAANAFIIFTMLSLIHI